MKLLDSVHGFFQDSLDSLSTSAERLASGVDLERSNQRVFFGLMAAFSFVSSMLFGVLFLRAGNLEQAGMNITVALVVATASVWAVHRKDGRWPMRVVSVAMVALLSVQTLRQGVGLHSAGWWLSVIPFILASGGFPLLAAASLGTFIVVVLVVYLAPSLNPFAGSLVDVTYERQLISILGSEMLAVALIVLSMKRRSKISRALDRAREAAVDAAEVKARFLANMSHKIRTPLLGLIGAIELMRSPTTSNKQREQLVSLADSSARTLHTLINDILDYSKLESGALSLESEPFNLRELCYQVNELFAIKAFDKGLELTSTCARDVPVRFIGDSVRIKQLVSNLVSNAVKFTQRGGVHIDLSMSRLKEPAVIAGEPAVLVRIEVTDTGIGLTPEQIDRLFRPFAQADSSITRRFGGTGLGLSISAELATAMGGSLTVKSTLGSGSTFTFTVPLRPHGAAVRRAPAPTSSILVAVASPNEGLRRHVTSLLGELGRLHESYPEAPSIASLVGVSTIVLDPLVIEDGALLAECVVRYAEAGLHVVLLQPLGSDSVVGLFGASSNVSIVHKPVRLSTLRKALEPMSRLNRIVADVVQLVGAPTNERVTSIDSPYADLRILVAEDNPVNQVIILAMLADLGATCVMTANGVEALNAFRTQRFDIVLMDLQMPELDGLGAARAMRQFEHQMPDCAVMLTPIVAMTANTERDETDARRDAGMSGFLGKPFRMSELQACLHHWCLQERETVY